MQKHLVQHLSILVVLLVATGCIMPTPPAAPATVTPGATGETTPPADTALENTQWQLVSFGPIGSEQPASEGATFTLTFAEGRAGGESGCNRFGGSYQVENDRLVFGELVSTLMACADEQVMQQEQQYLQALQSAGRFELADDHLTIWYDNDTSQLNFVPLSATAVTPEPPAGTDQPDAQNAETAERIEFESGGNSATRSGELAAGSDKNYALTAIAGQTIHVQTIGHSAPVSFTLYAPGGMAWTGEPQASDVYIFTTQATAPETGDYLVRLSVPADAVDTTYDATFTIEPVATQPMTPQPGPAERIHVDPSTGMAQRSGLMPTGPGVQQYVLSANAGRTLTIDVTSDGAPLSMTIESPSGNQWIPEMMPSADGYTIGHQFTLPEPGYYLVTLTKGDHTPSTNYTITFTLP